MLYCDDFFSVLCHFIAEKKKKRIFRPQAKYAIQMAIFMVVRKT